MTKAVAPPYTVASLKRCLCNIEGISDSMTARLFIASSSQAPMNDTERISLMSNIGPGLTAQEPMAFVVKISEIREAHSSLKFLGVAEALYSIQKQEPLPLNCTSFLNNTMVTPEIIALVANMFRHS